MGFLAYIDLTPYYFLGGLVGVAIVVWFAALPLRNVKGRSFVRWGVIGAYMILFWTAVTLFTDVRRSYEFDATWRIEVYKQKRHVVLKYVGYPNCQERIQAEALENVLLGKEGKSVRVKVEVVYDFRRVRAYGLEQVDGISVAGAWIAGSPPWEAFRGQPAWTRWE